MKVFVTGASGHIGSLVVLELLNAGHEVIGLGRSDKSRAKIKEMGAEVHAGSLEDLEGLASTAQAADGVIHLAFRHDLMQTGDMEGAAKADYEAVEAMCKVLIGSGKPFVGTGGTLALAFAGIGRTGTENDVLPAGPRIDTENYIIGLSEQNLRSSSVRLSPTVHGPMDNPTGFVPTLIRIAREKGFAAYVGDGTNKWSAVHELDAANLFRLALENAPAGSRLHGVGDEGVEFKAIAETIGQNLNLPTKSISAEEASEHFGHLGRFVVLDAPASSQITQELLSWRPTHPGLIEDLNRGDYFKL
jgi:nucleoside-diphosphate-sugar epimerase